jgi:hypothetical protein
MVTKLRFTKKALLFDKTSVKQFKFIASGTNHNIAIDKEVQPGVGVSMILTSVVKETWVATFQCLQG